MKDLASIPLRAPRWTALAACLVPITVPAPQAEMRLPHESVEYDAAAGDALWARGATFKASFDAHGATYIPFLGSRAPRNFPVAVRVENISVGGVAIPFDGAALPARTGDRVDFDRGPVVERYLLAPDSVEQLFVFERMPSAPSAGDLVVRMAVESDLSPLSAHGGIELSGAHGSVRYGLATVVDAAGASAQAETALVGGSIEIRVDAAFLATARFPVTIDPVISTFQIDTTTEDDSVPDVAYDSTNDRYLAVYEEVFSATDHDVRVRLLNSSGGVITSGYVDSTNANWRAPHVANHGGSNQFLVVATDFTNSTARGRTVAAASLTMSAQFTIGDGYAPDVGGTPSSGSSAFYLVAWTNTIEGIGPVVLTRAVRTDATLVGSGPLFAGFGNSSVPHVSKSNRGFDWNVVWAESGDIFGARLHSDGTLETTEFPIDTSAAVDEAPSVSSCLDSSSRYLVVYARTVGANRDITARLMDDATVVDTVDLSSLEGSTGVTDQFDAAVDSDGVGFAVAYTEFIGFPSPDEGAFVATLTPIGNQLYLGEGHRTLGNSSVDERHARIAANKPSGGASGEYVAVWEVAAGGTQLGNINGGLFDAASFTSTCFPGEDGVRACPCANPPSSIGRGCDNSSSTGGARLSMTGTASIASDSVVFHTTGERASALSVVWQGNTLVAAGAVFGQGVRCAGGSLKRLYTKSASSGALTAPAGGEPSVTTRSAALGDPLGGGTTRYHFVSYRDPNVLNGCPGPSTFNATQGGAITWRP